jgi:transcriptional regulator
MYSPAHFQEDRPSALIGLMEAHPLGSIVCNTPTGLVADHVPLFHAPEPNGLGKLIGHVAKNNPLWRILPEHELLVIFQGPSAYISPNWYASKHPEGKVVPTWNYAVVHAYCTLKAIQEPAKKLDIVSALTDRHESNQPHPWHVSDAPSEFIEHLLDHIVGVELTINRLQGKWKVSQNQSTANQDSVIVGLQTHGAETENQMAMLVKAYQSGNQNSLT